MPACGCVGCLRLGACAVRGLPVLLLLVLLLVLLFLLLHLLLLIMLPKLQVVQKLGNFMRLLLVCVQVCMGTHHILEVSCSCCSAS